MIEVKEFGSYEGHTVNEYTLRNSHGMEVSLVNYGATITRIITIDKNKRYGNVVLGYDNLPEYQAGKAYYGSTVGRYCNRIANGRFNLNGKEYQLAQNNNGHSLHGGLKGFDKVFWDVESQPENNSLTCRYTSPDGEEGFPGNLVVEVNFSLDDDDRLSIIYRATTDKPTPVNLTNHSYFNLSGGADLDVSGTEIQLFASQYTMIDSDLIPTGKIAPVKETALDFTNAKKIGDDIAGLGGYDHNFVLNNNNPGALHRAATVYEPGSGRFMEMFTTEPAVQFYTAPGFDPVTGKQIITAFCLEAQHYPDSPNRPSFPDTILQPGNTYRQTTSYKFSVR